MTEDKRKEIRVILGKAKWWLLTGVLIILIMPFLLTRQCFQDKFNFTETGQIGDTIGGITAPFMNLIGAILVFYALKAQVKANELIQDQIDKDNEDKEYENEDKNLNQLYSYLTDSISSFRFKTLATEQLKNTESIETEIEFIGGEAFYHLFSQILCHHNGTQDELYSHQAVSELLSILKIMDLLLNKLEKTKSKNKEILTTLVQHLFDYKIMTRIKKDQEDDLILKFCGDCQSNHGLPDELRKLIFQIKNKLLH
jgi:hypothetical protein